MPRCCVGRAACAVGCAAGAPHTCQAVDGSGAGHHPHPLRVRRRGTRLQTLPRRRRDPNSHQPPTAPTSGVSRRLHMSTKRPCGQFLCMFWSPKERNMYVAERVGAPPRLVGARRRQKKFRARCARHRQGGCSGAWGVPPTPQLGDPGQSVAVDFLNRCFFGSRRTLTRSDERKSRRDLMTWTIGHPGLNLESRTGKLGLFYQTCKLK